MFKKASHNFTSLGAFVSAFVLIPTSTFAANCFVNNEEIECGVFWEKFGIVFTLAFLIPGLLFIVKPQWILKLQTWEMKKFLAADFIPSKKTETIVRAFGVILVVIALAFVGLAVTK